MRHQLLQVTIIDGPHKGSVYKEVPFNPEGRYFRLANPLSWDMNSTIGPSVTTYFVYDCKSLFNEDLWVATPRPLDSSEEIAKLLLDYFKTDWRYFKFGV